MAVWFKRGPDAKLDDLPLWERMILKEEIYVIHELDEIRIRHNFQDANTDLRRNRATVLAALYREYRSVYLQLLYCLQIDELKEKYWRTKLYDTFQLTDGLTIIYREIWDLYNSFESDTHNYAMVSAMTWMESQQIEYGAEVVKDLFRIEVRGKDVTIKPRAMLKKPDAYYDEHPEDMDSPDAVVLDMDYQTLVGKFAEVLEGSKLVQDGVMRAEDVHGRRRAFLLLTLYLNPLKFGRYVLHHYMPDNHAPNSYISQMRQRRVFKPDIIMAFIYAVICTADDIENLTFWACDPENETPQYNKEFIDQFRSQMSAAAKKETTEKKTE